LLAGSHALLFDGRFCADIATATYIHAANKNKKESDDSTSDEGIRKRWQQQQQQFAERRLGRLGSSKEQRWSHVKISFDNESVRLEAADPTAAVAQLQPLPQQQQPPPPPTVVPPTIKIIGKEVRIEGERERE